TPPTLRMLKGGDHITLHRYGKRVYLYLGTWVATVGGDFEMRVARADYDSPIEANQVDSQTGEVLRSLPDNKLDGFNGMKKFIKVTFRDSAGSVVKHKKYEWCP